MNFFEGLLRYLGVSAFVSWLRSRKKGTDAEEEEREDQGTREKQEVIRPDGKLPWAPHGFKNPFDPHSHHALPEIQKRAVFALFDRLGLSWVPGEYFSILGRTPNPAEAFRKFCSAFSLDVQKIRQEDQDEIRGLHQCVGILVELDALKDDLMETHRLQIMSLMRDGAYYHAEHCLDAARLTFAILKESEELGRKIVFPHYHGFIGHLRTFADNPFDLTEEDVAEAREVNQAFIEFQERFDHVVGVINGEIAWMYENWPDNEWGSTNFDVRDGLVIEKERTEKSLTESPDEDIGEQIRKLEEILADLKKFIEEIQANFGGGDWREPEKDYLKSRLASWFWAIEFLGFGKDAEPSKDELKSAYRKKAMEYHPDRHMGKSPAKQKEFEELFKSTGEARSIIESGKPKTD